MISHRANCGTHTLEARGNDCYSTPPEAVLALLQAEQLPPSIWEPFTGSGNIVRVLRDRGRAVIASDIVAYNFPLHFVRDFLAETQAPAGTSAIVSNPPYRLAAECVEHGLRLVPVVVMLLRLAFLESERRSAILDHGQLACVHVFRDRLPMMHRRLDGPARFVSNSVCVVCVASRSSRSSNNQSYFVAECGRAAAIRMGRDVVAPIRAHRFRKSGGGPQLMKDRNAEPCRWVQARPPSLMHPESVKETDDDVGT